MAIVWVLLVEFDYTNNLEVDTTLTANYEHHHLEETNYEHYQTKYEHHWCSERTNYEHHCSDIDPEETNYHLTVWAVPAPQYSIFIMGS